VSKNAFCKSRLQRNFRKFKIQLCTATYSYYLPSPSLHNSTCVSPNIIFHSFNFPVSKNSPKYKAEHAESELSGQKSQLTLGTVLNRLLRGRNQSLRTENESCLLNKCSFGQTRCAGLVSIFGFN
jgi:hypothetical protein